MQNHNSKFKIVFFGSSNYVLPIIEVLRKNFDLSLVITTEKPEGAVPKYCKQNKIPYLSVSSLSDPNLKFKIKNLKFKIAVLADFGLIIPQEILNIFPKGIINVHPSLLPKYRGPTPVQTAILNGKKTTGVSILKLDEEVDHGPILFQVKENILPNDTSESLYSRLFEISSGSIVQIIEMYVKGEIKPKKQDHSKATFTKPLTRQDGYVDISNATTAVIKIERMIRAYYPWPGVWTQLKINDKLLRIKLLPGNKLQIEGKKPMSYKDFINGYPQAEKIHSLLKAP